MAEHLEQFLESAEDYMSMNEKKSFELREMNKKEESKSQESLLPTKQRQTSSLSKPLLFITVLLCTILILLLILLGSAGWFAYDHYFATGNNTDAGGNAVTAASSSSNTNEWADRIAQKVYEKLGSIIDCTKTARTSSSELADSIAQEVSQKLLNTLRFPDFNDWANGVSQNTLQLFQNNTNFTELDKQILETTRDSAQKLINIVNTLSNLQDTSTSTAGVVNGMLLVTQELLVLHNDSTALPTSCKEIKERQPLSPSGLYLLADVNTEGATYTAYCNMGTLCGSGGGWTRLAYLDMTDATQNCPSGFRLYQSGGVRACGRPITNNGSCASVDFPSNGISYSQICGRVTGYQYHSPDAFVIGSNNTNSYYVDGVSITRGCPRQHVWTLANGLTDSYNNNPQWICPCATGSSQTVPSFVGNHYFCESGNHASTWSPVLYTSDPLWDGKGCGSLESPCCNVPGIPWFHRDYGSNTTTDHIELRVCGDQESANEDSPVSFYDIYVK